MWWCSVAGFRNLSTHGHAGLVGRSLSLELCYTHTYVSAAAAPTCEDANLCIVKAICSVQQVQVGPHAHHACSHIAAQAAGEGGQQLRLCRLLLGALAGQVRCPAGRTLTSKVKEIPCFRQQHVHPCHLVNSSVLPHILLLLLLLAPPSRKGPAVQVSAG